MPGSYPLRRCGTSRVRVCFALLAFVAGATAFGGVPQLTRDINTLLPAVDSDAAPLGTVGSTIYISAVTDWATGSRGLYRSDGTAAGTVLLKTFDGDGPVVADGVPAFLAVGTKAYFVAQEESTGQEVWVTDGTAAGTHIVRDSSAGAAGGAQLIGVLGTDLVFATPQGGTNWQVFRTDGSAGGTVQLSDF